MHSLEGDAFHYDNIPISVQGASLHYEVNKDDVVSWAKVSVKLIRATVGTKTIGVPPY